MSLPEKPPRVCRRTQRLRDGYTHGTLCTPFGMDVLNEKPPTHSSDAPSGSLQDLEQGKVAVCPLVFPAAPCGDMALLRIHVLIWAIAPGTSREKKTLPLEGHHL